MNLAFTDDDPYALTVRAGVVLYERGVQYADADATLTLPRLGMFAILKNDTAAQAKNIQVEGDPDVLKKLTEHLVDFDFFFPIVEP